MAWRLKGLRNCGGEIPSGWFLTHAFVVLLQTVTKNTRNADNDFSNWRVLAVRKLLSSTNQAMVAVRPG